jgi:hypothetical protein
MKITLLGPAATEPGSRTAICDFGVGQGIVIDAKVVDAVDSRGVCKEAIPQYGPVGGWAWTLDDAKSVTAGGGGPGVVAGNYNATNGVCHGSLRVYLIPNGADLFAPSDGGTTAPATLEADYFATTYPAPPDTGSGNVSCPLDCQAWFPVAVSRVD